MGWETFWKGREEPKEPPYPGEHQVRALCVLVLSAAALGCALQLTTLWTKSGVAHCDSRVSLFGAERRVPPAEALHASILGYF